MKMSHPVFQTITELEEKRIAIQNKRNKFFPWLFLTPILLTLAIFLIFNHIGVSVFTSIFSIIGSAIFYSVSIGAPFKKLHQKLREVLLGDYMRTHHPTINYNYFAERQKVREIIKNSKLISADIYKEQDVVIGEMKGSQFYLSEIHLLDEHRNNNKKRTVTVFKGLLFKIKIPGKQFPNAQIESKRGFLTRLFGKFEENKEMGFWYDTDNVIAFEEKLQPLFPFIKYLIEKQGDVRIKTQDDSITIMIESDMKFLDNPEPKIANSFLNKVYYENIGKQINSLLFIIESFINNFTTSEIEEKLELKAIEIIKASESIN